MDQNKEPNAAGEINAPAGSLSPRAARVRAMFNSIAPSYDSLNRLLSLSVDRHWRRRTVARSIEALGAVSSPTRVLDVCAGTGDLSLAFARRLKRDGSRIVALDYSREMLERAGEKFIRRSLAAPLIEADALRLPFRDESFDLTAVAFGLRNWVDRPAGLREMARVTRSGGIVAVLEFAPPRAWWLRGPYTFYLNRVLPTVGDRLTGTQAYGYLAETIGGLPPPEETLGWLREAAGLRDVQATPLTGGIAMLYLGRKP